MLPMAKFRPAATVLVVRASETPSGVQIALMHRSPTLRFLGNFWVFPGGKVDRGEEPAFAALREAFEESGLLLVPGGESVPEAERAAKQRALLASEVSFESVVEGFGLSLSFERLTRCGGWRTPPFGPVRFDTTFFIAAVAADASLDVVEGELDHAEWLDPVEAVARWRRDEALLAPPTRVTLEALIATPRPADQTLEAWLPEAAAAIGASHPADGEFWGCIDFRPGLRLVLLRTPTLPPATHTNCLIVGDGSEVVVIDAASPYEDEQQRLDGIIDALAADGRSVRELILTHHHHDHSSGAQVLADRLGVGIAAHERTRELLAGKVTVTRTLSDGELIELPADLPNSRPRRLRVWLTEGHADGHLVFHEEETGSVIAGDMVAGIGTILVDPPEGKMALYLESLAKLKALNGSLIYPSHGPPIGAPASYVQHIIDHRLAREAKVLGALQGGPSDIDGLLPKAYDDKPPAIYPLAARAALAHLEKLEHEGAVARDGDVWRAL
jgi:endoribonuclease LACTB2